MFYALSGVNRAESLGKALLKLLVFKLFAVLVQEVHLPDGVAEQDSCEKEERDVVKVEVTRTPLQTHLLQDHSESDFHEALHYKFNKGIIEQVFTEVVAYLLKVSLVLAAPQFA